jgi:class 3 adenylate cyclase
MGAPRARVCKGCRQQLHLPVPLRGVASFPFRAIGIRPSRMNPNICTICEKMFTTIMQARKVSIDVTVMFADLRDYTVLSRTLPSDEISRLLDFFYDTCAEAVWKHDGILNKTIGDAIMAVFNFPIRHADHPARAVAAAREIQRGWQERRELRQGSEGDGEAPGIGIGIDSGIVSFGEFGRSHRDLTAIGTVVNTAARVQGAATPGQILVTQAVRERMAPALQDAEGRPHELKGLGAPLDLYAVL